MEDGRQHELVIGHFNHEHPLRFFEITADEETEGSDCKGCGGEFSSECGKKVSGYSCEEESCEYRLHVGCAELPTEINHIADEKHHPLLLVASDEDKFWWCNACLERIEGFNYECRDCDLDLHPLCANMPTQVQIPSHTHALTLITKAPIPGSDSNECDLCGLFGRIRWFYCCRSCNFTVDTDCALNEGQNSKGETSDRTVIEHFSHEHPLYFFDLSEMDKEEKENDEGNGTCDGCKEIFSETQAYVCIQDSCEYGLHVGCAELAAKIDHPVDEAHYLVLVAEPPYPGEVFCCTACRKIGRGFFYRCSSCRLDIHPHCAEMPLHIEQPAHKQHALTLSFKPAYWGLGFVCDICGEHGRKRWYYRCKSCGLEMHKTVHSREYKILKPLEGDAGHARFWFPSGPFLQRWQLRRR